jgi:Malonyl-CoA decarboxylase C-terminal domain
MRIAQVERLALMGARDRRQLKARRVRNDDTALLQHLMANERVHRAASLDDFRQRVHANRRLYTLQIELDAREYNGDNTQRVDDDGRQKFKNMSKVQLESDAECSEPLAFINVALVPAFTEHAGSMDTLLNRDFEESLCRVAVFYSISSIVQGLSVGADLIHGVVDELRADATLGVRHFVTLSPMPGFAKWLGGNAQRRVDDGDGDDRDAALKRAALGYLLGAKQQQQQQRALDPVANFHLGNGAAIGCVRVGADRSEQRAQQSLGVMVNYHYELPLLAERRRRYRESGHIEQTSTSHSLFQLSSRL